MPPTEEALTGRKVGGDMEGEVVGVGGEVGGDTEGLESSVDCDGDSSLVFFFSSSVFFSSFSCFAFSMSAYDSFLAGGFSVTGAGVAVGVTTLTTFEEGKGEGSAGAEDAGGGGLEEESFLRDNHAPWRDRGVEGVEGMGAAGGAGVWRVLEAGFKPQAAKGWGCDMRRKRRRWFSG